MARTRILVADDSETVRVSLSKLLEHEGFEVVCAEDAPSALKLISQHSFDVLLSDLHMPGPGDGLTVVSAMRHANPKAVTLLLSAFPQMKEAANAILLQADEILIKPMQIKDLLKVIEDRLQKGPPLHRRVVETVARILERTAQNSIEDWSVAVENDEVLTEVTMSRELRGAHLPQLFRELVTRLQTFKPLGSKDLKSASAAAHGKMRREQGYTAAMLVEESRILQVTIFHTLQKNLASIDFSTLLMSVMTIADEVDSQLSQAMVAYIAASGLAGAVPQA